MSHANSVGYTRVCLANLSGYTKDLHPNKSLGTSFSVGDRVRVWYPTMSMTHGTVIAISPSENMVNINDPEVGVATVPLDVMEKMIAFDEDTFSRYRKMKGRALDTRFYHTVYWRPFE